jgi:hypothetical protein
MMETALDEVVETHKMLNSSMYNNSEQVTPGFFAHPHRSGSRKIHQYPFLMLLASLQNSWGMKVIIGGMCSKVQTRDKDVNNNKFLAGLNC